MKTQKLVAVLIIALLAVSTMNAQEKDHSKMKKEVTKVDMKTVYTCPMHADVKSETPGDCSKCKMKLVAKEMPVKSKSEKAMHGKKMKAYSCPMHPEVVSTKPDKCTKCGMKLTEKKMEMKKEKKEKDAAHNGHSHE